MQNLVGCLDKNSVKGEDGEPWGELVLLSAKKHQENVPRHEYQWRMCVSYPKRNQVNNPFSFPIHCYNDAVQYIDTEAECFISVYTDSEYLHVIVED